jgi:Ran GTPase-activating protein (RanGAP) involved in mRNA processing and transport
MLQMIDLSGNYIGDDLTSQIAEKLKKNCLTKKRNYCKFICAFIDYRIDSVRLRFDKMMLRFLYYPILGVADEMRFEE